MRNKLLFVVLIGFLVSAVVPGTANAQSQQPIKLSMSNYLPIKFSATPVIGAFCEELGKRTNGRVQVTYYPGGTLTTGPKVYDGIINQVSDMGISHIGYTRGRFPITEMLDLPVGYSSGFVCTHVKHDFYMKFKPKEWDDVQVLYMWSPGPNVFATRKKPLTSIEDLKGLKFRGVGRPGDTIKALGAVPVAIEMVDVYDGVQRGLLDGTFEGVEGLAGFRQGDVVKFLTLTQRGCGLMYTFYVAINKDKWKALPDDIKNIFTQTAEEWVEKEALTTYDADFAGLDYFYKQGGKLVKMSDEELAKMRKAVEPVITSYMTEMEGKGYKKADLDPMLQFIRERIAYWSKVEIDRKLKNPYAE